jgi:hypothetical protein
MTPTARSSEVPEKSDLVARPLAMRYAAATERTIDAYRCSVPASNRRWSAAWCGERSVGNRAQHRELTEDRGIENLRVRASSRIG